MPEIQDACDRKLVVSGTITLHPRIADSPTRVAFGVVDELAVPVLLGTAFIDRFVNSIQPTERKIIPSHTPPIFILLIHDARSAAEKNSSDIRKFIEHDPHCW